MSPLMPLTKQGQLIGHVDMHSRHESDDGQLVMVAQDLNGLEYELPANQLVLVIQLMGQRQFNSPIIFEVI